MSGPGCDSVSVTLTVNGRSLRAEVEPRTLLIDFLRSECRLTGTHLGCAHGVCGACTVMIEGESARSCLALVASLDGASVRTVEDLAGDGPLTDLQEAFREHHALQCGFCTPGFLIAAEQLLKHNAAPDDADIRRALAGNLCRCTGYVGIVRAVKAAAAMRAAAKKGGQ